MTSSVADNNLKLAMTTMYAFDSSDACEDGWTTSGARWGREDTVEEQNSTHRKRLGGKVVDDRRPGSESTTISGGFRLNYGRFGLVKFRIPIFAPPPFQLRIMVMICINLSVKNLHPSAYNDSRGNPGVRKEIAEFIERCDGYPSKGVMQFLNTIIRGNKDGILVPVPQYPLYSAAISLYGGSLVPYYLKESANWGLDVNNLRDNLRDAVR
ncbi:hypothetical protein Dimus_031900 [Dionaea muscipula]